MLDLHNKVLLISLCHIDENESKTRDTFFGVVRSFNDNTVVVDKCNGGEIDLPYAENHFEAATDEWYELKNGDWSDEVDYIVELDVFSNDLAYERFGEKNT